PTLVESESRLKWLKHNFNVVTNYTSKSSFWTMQGKFESVRTDYEDDNYSNFDNIKRYFSLHNEFNFFPETAIFFGVRAGYSTYLAGMDVEPYGNSDSVHYEGYLGVDGRITSTVSMDVKLGFIWLDYQFGSDFHEPVFLLKFTDMFSGIHSVSAGYERMVYDSMYSNFYVNQRMFLEFKSLWFDNFINMTTIQYVNRYYRQSGKRIDHGLAFITEMAVPVFIFNRIGQNISLIGRFLAEWLNSDAYNIYGWYTGQDMSADYKRFYILLGLTTKY
ncbi:MAG: hypothetical protein JXA66_05000, partial [Oligoflexia bacterium]|nr:hypothetical protein [Oligoflexia bacterium]